MFVHVCGGECIPEYMYADERSMSDMSPSIVLLFFETVSHQTWSLSFQLDWMANKLPGSINVCLSPALGSQMPPTWLLQ